MWCVCGAVFLDKNDPKREWLINEAERLGGEVTILGDEVLCECLDDDFEIIRLFEAMPIHTIKAHN